MREVVGESEQRLRSAIDMIEELAPCVDTKKEKCVGICGVDGEHTRKDL